MGELQKNGRYRPRCPKCGWQDTRISASRGIFDRVLATFSLAPYRCRSCGGRFYRLRREPRRSEPEDE